MNIWVNKAYQGYIPAGKTCYMPREGFATPDSGWQPDDTLKIQRAYGGWNTTDPLLVVARPMTPEGSGWSRSSSVWQSKGYGSSSEGKVASVIIGEDAMALELDSYERETARKLHPGSSVPVADKVIGIPSSATLGNQSVTEPAKIKIFIKPPNMK